MDIRDPRLVDVVRAQPFAGYARHDGDSHGAALERVVACVALLATMVLSGLLLGGAGRTPSSR